MNPLTRAACATCRRIDFRGKGRLVHHLPVPRTGIHAAGFPEGFRLELDLREQSDRSLFCGLYDRLELRLVAGFLAPGGDFVDVGANVGLYTVAAALAGSGRVLAFEPNPAARERLARNLALNGCTNAIVSPHAVAGAPGRAALHVPSSPDTAWSSLVPGLFSEGPPIDVETTTLDAEVERHGLAPVCVKIDVEGAEVRVLDGMTATLVRRPAVICEVSASSAVAAEQRLAALGYRVYRLGRRSIRPGLGTLYGRANALFVHEAAGFHP